MATDAATLLAAGTCYACAPPGTWQLLKLGLLKQLLLALDPMADTTPTALLEAVKCYACTPPGMWQLLELGLLKAIADAGGVGGGSGSVLCDTADPVADPGISCAFHIRTDTGQLWYWNDGSASWIQLIA